jgi:hypothetical protein
MADKWLDILNQLDPDKRADLVEYLVCWRTLPALEHVAEICSKGQLVDCGKWLVSLFIKYTDAHFLTSTWILLLANAFLCSLHGYMACSVSTERKEQCLSYVR